MSNHPATAPVGAAKATGALVSRVVSLSPALWAAVDEYWHEKRLASRTAAIRVLLEKGLGS